MSGADTDAAYATEPGPAGTRFSEVRHFVELDSTNRYLADVARTSPRAGLVAVAEHQTAGRGRLGRRWEAPAGTNLLASILLVPVVPIDDLHLCSVAVALAAVQACNLATGLEPALKWPNDLVVGDRKLAGILAESVPMPAAGTPSTPAGAAERSVVVGIGVNVRWPPPDSEPSALPVPVELRGIATSLRRETGRDVEPRALLDLLLGALEPRLLELDEAAGRRRLIDEYRDRCSTIGKLVRVVLPSGETTGTARGISQQGHLVVEPLGAPSPGSSAPSAEQSSAGSLVTVTAGDVVHVLYHVGS